MQDLTVADILPCLDVEPATVGLCRPLGAVLTLAARFPGPRRLYVVDDEQNLCGVVDPHDLAEFLMPEHVLWGESSREAAYGMLSYGAILRSLSAGPPQCVGDVMSLDPASTWLGDRLADALATMRQAGVSELPVADDTGQVLGELSILHVVAWHRQASSPRAVLSVVDGRRVQS